MQTIFAIRAKRSSGTAAAGFQSSFGTPIVFRILQSAAMGGYGAPVVAGLTQVVSFAGAAAVGIFGKAKSQDGGQDSVEMAGESHDEGDADQSDPSE